MNLKVKHKYETTNVLKNIKFYHEIIKDNLKIQDNIYETLVVLIKGKIKLEYNGQIIYLQRKEVFTEKASAIYIPINEELEISSINEAEIAICKAHSSKVGKIQIITPEEIKEQIRGKEGFMRRVYDIIDSNGPSEKLVVGETINYNGQWSSYPPHKHDENNNEEVKMEELYLFKLNPENGFGFQRIYTEDGSLDETMTIVNNDITLIPKGYHPVSVMPGYEIYYLWVLVGDNKILMPYTQNKYQWLLK